MELKQKKKFIEAFTGLCVAFDKQPSEALFNIYWKSLKKYEFKEVMFAVSEAINRLKFFPKVAELIEFIPKPDSLSAEEAWGKVMGGLTHGVMPQHEAIAAAIDRIGGWPYLCTQSYDQLRWIEKRFIEHYRDIEDKERLELSYEKNTRLLQ